MFFHFCNKFITPFFTYQPVIQNRNKKNLKKSKLNNELINQFFIFQTKKNVSIRFNCADRYGSAIIGNVNH